MRSRRVALVALVLSLALVAWWWARAGEAQTVAVSSTADCGTCHASQVAVVSASHHARGQGLADGGAKFFIGVEPLQQFVFEFDGGALQVSPHARLADGGALELTSSAALWTEPAFNWSGSCAPCHATGFVVRTNTWRELSVGCEACHGDAQGHRAWLASGKPAGTTASGFARSLSGARNEFRFPDDGGAIASAQGLPDDGRSDLELDTCGGCHSRRRALTDDGALTGRYFDRFEPALMEPGLYGADGFALDEVFELGSFLMSPMHAAGVRCTNCHDPHSGQLRAEGDALCAQCHRLEAFAPHANGQPCVSCHMPAKVFLGVNERRDHFLHGKASGAASSFQRASALASSRDPAEVRRGVESRDAWLRYGAATALRALAPRDRLVGVPLLKDELRAIRVRAARALVGVSVVPSEVLAELDAAERANGFRGEAWLNLGMTALALGERAQAEAHFRHGLEVEPRFAPLTVNLADLLRETGRDAEGRALLERAVASGPHPAWVTSLHYALGLARWRAGDKRGALEAFTVAKADGEATHVRAWELAVRELAAP